MKSTFDKLKHYSEQEFLELKDAGYPVNYITHLTIKGLGHESSLYYLVGTFGKDNELLISMGIDRKTGLTNFPVRISLDRILFVGAINEFNL